MHSDTKVKRKENIYIPGAPPPPKKKKKKKKHGTVDFSGLCSHQQLSVFTLLDRTSFLIIITPRSSDLVENF